MAVSKATFTGRGAGALSAGLLVLLLAFYTTNILVFVVAVFLLAFVLCELLAFTITTRGFGPDAFSVERVECSSLVAVGGAGLLSLRVTSRLPGGFYAEVSDTVPGPLAVREGDPHLLTWWTGGETLTIAYVVSPDLRGLFDVGPTLVVAHDPLGFAFKTARLENPWTVESMVESATPSLGHPTRLASLIVGQTSLSAPGAGSDFRGLREYEPTDELRRIAWTRSGQGKMYVRENERESQQDLVVLLDVGRGMATGSGYENALEKAIEAAARVLRLAFDEGGRGGLVVYGSRVLAYVPPGRGSSHEFRVFRELTGAEQSPTASSLAGALDYLRLRLDRPTSLFAFGSLTEDLSKLLTASATLQPAGHRLYAMVPEAGRMYGEITDPSHRDAFEMLVEPETRRARRAGTALASTGAAVGFFGKDDAIGAVVALYSSHTGARR
ncbi:MAG: DUF58 domain-containing protein [Thermoplasmata archaeon]